VNIPVLLVIRDVPDFGQSSADMTVTLESQTEGVLNTESFC